ncbi:hypothetical protein [Xenorhabdus eapokensis]|uniref:Uncharacterized protein n=1 Tax=Xenorhabdus eapokensis TaxID=1873482 RepID=A0A1Q5TKR5_9GAMM|nr:hypothetical protein [Xenorhabdus eapokensis]OKP00804.1 hypothetical protein Xedl_03118 [Xenorhabdus eapokensis]
MTDIFQIQMLQEAIIRLCSDMKTLAQANDAFKLANDLLLLSQGSDLNPVSEAIYESVREKRNQIANGTTVQTTTKQPPYLPVREKADKSRSEAAKGKRNVERWSRKRRLGDMAALPPYARDQFTEGERAVLYIVAADIRQHGSCRCTNKEIGDRAGVCLTTTRNALRKARQHGLLNIRQRPQWRGKNLSNIITMACKLWRKWLDRFRPKLGFNFSLKGVKKAVPLETNSKRNLEKKENFLEKTLSIKEIMPMDFYKPRLE